MSNTFDWQQAIHDPRFWAIRYWREFPGETKEASDVYIEENDFFNLAILEEDPLAGYVGEGDDPQQAEVEVGYRRLSLSFPEDYSWQIDFAAEEGDYLSGIYHSLRHPTLYPASTYRDGAYLAAEGPDDHLPGLRWAEFKQIEACLRRHWQEGFDVNAIVPLLYRVVQFITPHELEDVRQTLTTAWQRLQVLDASQIDQWLAQIIIVYDNGQCWQLDEQKWKLCGWGPGIKGDLWIQEEGEWKTPIARSKRNINEDSCHFLPFFSMLERYS